MKIREVMTQGPVTCSPTDVCGQAATLMKQEDCGSIPVVEDGRLVGIVTDRDIVVRAIADGRDPETPIGEIATRDPRTVTPDQPLADAIKIMRDDDVRRVPVLQDGRPTGIVSLGDLALEQDPESALADISSGSQNN